MKKRVSILLLLIGFVFSSISVSAKLGELKSLDNSEKNVVNEYDCIIFWRSLGMDGLKKLGMTDEEAAYILSDKIESEYLYRASLSEWELKNEYLYKDDAIAILKRYNGQRLENVPEMRAASASLETSIERVSATDTRVALYYAWHWDLKPTTLKTDYAAIAWAGTYENGLSNNMRFDSTSSWSYVTYYDNLGHYKQAFINNISVGNSIAGVSVNFPMQKSIDSVNCWAREGKLHLFLDLVNQENGPHLYELHTHAEYAHYSSTVSAGVSYPYALTISFSGSHSVMGVENLNIRP